MATTTSSSRDGSTSSSKRTGRDRQAETQCVRVELAPDSYDRVQSWANEIRRRRREAIITLVKEGVVVESVFYEEMGDQAYLIYYLRAADMERAIEVGGELIDDLQRYHHQFKRDVWKSVRPLELVLDLEVCESDLTP